MNTEVVCGSPQTVARTFSEILRETRVDGIILALEDYMVDSERFVREVMPYL